MEVILRKDFKRYKVFDTGLKDPDGKNIFWVIKKNIDGDDAGYVSRPNRPDIPFEFVEAIFTESLVVVRCGGIKEDGKYVKRFFTVLSSETWNQVPIALVAGHPSFKCINPKLNKDGTLELTPLIPQNKKISQ